MSTEAATVMVWTDAGRAAAVSHVLDLMGAAVHPVAVGGTRSTEVTDLAHRLESKHADDFRHLLIDTRPTFVLIGSMAGLSHDDVAAAAEQGAIVLTLEPVDAGFESLLGVSPRAGTTGDENAAKPSPNKAAMPGLPGGRVVMTPSFMRSPGWIAAANPLEVVGQVRTIGFTSFGPARDSSLFARLFDAWSAILSLAQLPEVIDASIVGSPAPGSAAGNAPALTSGEIPDNPRQLTGHLSAHARLPDAASAVLRVSDQVGRASRWLQIIGDQGRADIGDIDYQVFDHTGQVLDRSKAPPGPAAVVDLVVTHWRRILDRPELLAAATPEPDEAHVLACCLACQLSARTGQPESPGKLLELARRR